MHRLTSEKFLDISERFWGYAENLSQVHSIQRSIAIQIALIDDDIALQALRKLPIVDMRLDVEVHRILPRQLHSGWIDEHADRIPDAGIAR